jgi:hypothetical protein
MSTIAADAQYMARTFHWETDWNLTRGKDYVRNSLFVLSCGEQTLRWTDPPSKKPPTIVDCL